MENIAKLYKILREDCIAQSQKIVHEMFHIEIEATMFQDEGSGVKMKSKPVLYERYWPDQDSNKRYHGTVRYSHEDIMLMVFLKNTRKFVYESMFSVIYDLDDETLKLIERVGFETDKVLHTWLYNFDTFQYRKNGFFGDEEVIELEYMDYATLIPIFSFMFNHEVGHIVYSRLVKNNLDVPEKTSLMLKQILLFVMDVINEYQKVQELSEKVQSVWIEEIFADVFSYNWSIHGVC